MNVVLGINGPQYVPTDTLKFFGIDAPGGNGKFTDCLLESSIQTVNHHVYCMSFTKGEHLFKEFDKADTCVEVLDPRTALIAIGTELIRKGYMPAKTRYGSFQCFYFVDSYVTHQTMKRDGINPWQVKDSLFKIQDECRFVYKTNVETPIILEVPDLVKLIRLVEF